MRDYILQKVEGRIFTYQSPKSGNTVQVRCFTKDEIEEYQSITEKLTEEYTANDDHEKQPLL